MIWRVLLFAALLTPLRAANVFAILDGTSHTAGGVFATTVASRMAALGDTYIYRLIAVSGGVMGNFGTCTAPGSLTRGRNAPCDLDPHLADNPGYAIGLWFDAPTNDCCSSTDQEPRMIDYWSRRKAACVVAGVTCKILSSTLMPTDTRTDTERGIYNTWVRGQCASPTTIFDNGFSGVVLACAAGSPLDYLVDNGADTRMGCAGCNHNATYFQSDHLHLTTVNGQPLFAEMLTRALLDVGNAAPPLATARHRMRGNADLTRAVIR